MGIIGKVARKAGKCAAVLVIAKMIAPSDADAQTRFYGGGGFYGYGNPCLPPRLYWQYYNLYNLYAASPRISVQPGVVVGSPYSYYNQYYANVPAPRYYIEGNIIYDRIDGSPVDSDARIKELEDEIARLKKDILDKQGPDGDNDRSDKSDERPDYKGEKEFSYVMRYSGKVCDNQLDDVTIGYIQTVFDCERKRTNWGSDYAVYDIGGYRLVVRDNNNKKIGEINLRKYSGKNGRDIISGIKDDLKNMNIVGAESIDSVRVDYRNYSCEN